MRPERTLTVTSLWGTACTFVALYGLMIGRPASAQQPSIESATGKAIYEQHCLKCHGLAGRGDGPQAPWQMVRPANFHSPASRSKSDEQLLSIMEHGLIFSPMHEWRDRLTEAERHEVLAYIRVLAEQADR